MRASKHSALSSRRLTDSNSAQRHAPGEIVFELQPVGMGFQGRPLCHKCLFERQNGTDVVQCLSHSTLIRLNRKMLSAYQLLSFEFVRSAEWWSTLLIKMCLAVRGAQRHNIVLRI
jgi:hypothetical protein